MSVRAMMELPHLIKPLALFLLILQLIFMFFRTHSFFWFVILTTILMLIVTLVMFAIFATDFAAVTEAPYWWMAETIIAAVFAVFNLINFFYFVVNMFGHFYFTYLFTTSLAVLQCLIWGFDAFYWFRNRTSSTSSPYPNNQATASPAPHPAWPAGANPA